MQRKEAVSPTRAAPTTPKGDLVTAPEEVYNDPPEVLAIFDVRVPGTAARLHRERAAWAENGDIEALDQNHYVLIVRPGVALVGTEEGGAHEA
jgi:hypothetical protein